MFTQSTLRKFTIFLIAIVTLSMNANAEVEVGKPFPDFAPFELEGKLPTELKGKVILVDYWASWCGPCRASFPAMEELQKRYGESGFVVIAVSVDRKVKDYDRFLAKYRPTFTTLRDGKQKMVEAVSPPAMPTSYLIGKDGRLRFIHKGFHKTKTPPQYASEIEQLLAE